MRWGFALRIAARDALQHKGRSLLVLTMIALPVLVVSAVITLFATSEVSGPERIERKMGAAEAIVWSEYRQRVEQVPDPFDWERWPVGGRVNPDITDVAAVLGPDAHFVEKRSGYVEVRGSDRRLVSFMADEVDLTHPVTRGLFELTDGRLPLEVHEVVVNEPSAEAGFEIGTRIKIPGVEEPAVVVGVGHDATLHGGFKVIGPIGSLFGEVPRGGTGDIDDIPQAWLIEGVEVTWSHVEELNQLGFFVGSRSVIEDPTFNSSDSWLRETVNAGDGAETLTVILLVIVMALIEVALLAGPAFAVSARSQARTLALVAMAGGTPVQARRVILAAGVVLGTFATVLGLVLGVVAARMFQPLAQRSQSLWFGPFEVPWGWLVPVAVFGLLSALAAAVVPARLASRQDPVAVMAGRRADAAPDPRTPVLGLALLLMGVLGVVLGVNLDNGGPVVVAVSVVCAMVGMILVTPLLVMVVAALAGSMPFSIRYAARDASRHRGRTVPAVAAVAATVAGVVAIGIGTASIEKSMVENYQYDYALGDGEIVWYPEDLRAEEGGETTWETLADVAREAAPEVRVSLLRSPIPTAHVTEEGYAYWELGDVAVRESEDSYSGGYVEVRIAPDTGVIPLGSDERERADAALAAGRAVVFTDREEGERDVVLSRALESESDEEDTVTFKATIPALLVRTEEPVRTAAVIPEELARASGLESKVSGVHLAGVSDEATEERIEEALRRIDFTAEAVIERGPYTGDTELLLLVLGIGGAVLMLAGTLTATFLALSDARPDLATLSAVGGAPRTRRAVAGSYALLIGFTGALLGAVVGFVPGLGAALSMTAGPQYSSGDDRYFEVPWLLIASIVVLLPILTAAIVWVSARSRLPLVARVE